jgi:dTDP-D-glucose 4,6-dehydratase
MKYFYDMNYLKIITKSPHLDSSKIKKELAWICQYSFSEGIKKTVIWYMKNLNNNYFKNKDYKKRIGLEI